MADELQLTLAFGLAFCIALVTVPFAGRLARRLGFLDYPVGFKKHPRATPYLGGAAIMATALPVALLVGGWAHSFAVIVLCALGLSFVGTIDDRIGLSPQVRVFIEVGAALILWNSGLAFHVSNAWALNLGLTTLWVVGLVNAFNLMDNLDGAAGTVSLVSAMGAAIVCAIEGDLVLASMALAISGACAGFLPFNLARPSRIFLGDGGSMPIGFLIAAILMSISPRADIGRVAVLAFVPFVGLPVLDTSLVVISRLRRGVPVFTGGRDHLTHRLLPFLRNPRAVAVALGLTQLWLCLMGLALIHASTETVIVTTAAYLTLSAAAIRLLEGSLVLGCCAELPVSRPGQGRWCRTPAAAPRNHMVESNRTSAGRPVKILRVIARLNMGGPAHHVGLLGVMLDPARYETLLLYGDAGGGENSIEETVRDYGAAMLHVPGLRPELRPYDDIRALAALVREIRDRRPDVVHTHTAKAGMLGRLAAVLAGGPRPVIVHTYHGHVLEGYFGPIQNAAYRTIERGLAGVSDALIGVSRATVEDLVRLNVASRSKFRVIPVGLDLERFLSTSRGDGAEFRRRVGIRPGEVLLVFGGRLVPIKRLDVLLKAVCRARELHAPVRLAIVGDGELRSALERLASELRVAEFVHFEGYRRNMVPVAAAADVAVLSSDNEGTPVWLIEAAAAGQPAAATSVGGVPEVVINGTGMLSGQGDSEALAASFCRLAMDERLRAEMGNRARSYVSRQFSAQRLAEEVADLYTELMPNRIRARSSPFHRTAHLRTLLAKSLTNGFLKRERLRSSASSP